MMESTVELSQKEKLKKFNEKLQMMMKNKNIDKSKLVKTTSATKKEEHPQQSKTEEARQPQQQKIPLEKADNQVNNQLDEHESQSEQDPQNEDGKTKKIKKGKTQKKQSNVALRKVAGVVWKDKSLEEWPENDYRIFVGNLGNQVTDEILSSVFRNKYNSFQMARVVLDKRIGKSKGYGFVSFKEPKDFLNALKEMNNKYIGNRPVKVTKSNWKDRALESQKNKMLPSDFQANKGKETNKICANFKYVSPY